MKPAISLVIISSFEVDEAEAFSTFSLRCAYGRATNFLMRAEITLRPPISHENMLDWVKSLVKLNALTYIASNWLQRLNKVSCTSVGSCIQPIERQTILFHGILEVLDATD